MTSTNERQTLELDLLYSTYEAASVLPFVYAMKE